MKEMDTNFDLASRPTHEKGSGYPDELEDLPKGSTLKSPKLSKPSESSTDVSFEDYEIDLENDSSEREEYPQEVMKVLKKADEQALENLMKLGKFRITSNLCSSNGEKYKSYFGQLDSNEKRNGRGIQVLKDGSIYEGEFKNGKHNGIGRYISATNVYCGHFYHGRATGKGVLQDLKEDAKYKGYFKEMKPDGKCTKIHSNGSKFIGEFSNGVISGFGKYEWNDGSSYSGQFKFGLKEGKGKDIDSKGNIYDGQFKENKYHGKGFLRLKNGCTYKGNFVNGKKSGKGVCQWPDGRFYDGKWEDDKMDGIGVFKDKMGKEKKAKFSQGKMIALLE
ncbi:unnamed protein product [Moneuplotes crassus]|uniref:Phosphatidylinositol-4-phosphate 5-kinase n=1 Tax=Euplotes crassus TaxID=5936 RepID=A0AAD2CY29_EUPCR|nr:unnamed protein product [Moneuplotes crassus]